MLSLFALKNMGKELSTNSDNILDALLLLHPDGFQEPLPIR